MKEITEKEYSACYELAKLVYDGKQTKKVAIEILSRKDGLGMNKSSATYYVNAYLAMRTGKTYTKTINNNATEYYLEHIYSENGKDALRIALKSLQGQIDYYSKLGKGVLAFLQALHAFLEEDVINTK